MPRRTSIRLLHSKTELSRDPKAQQVATYDLEEHPNRGITVRSKSKFGMRAGPEGVSCSEGGVGNAVRLEHVPAINDRVALKYARS